MAKTTLYSTICGFEHKIEGKAEVKRSDPAILIMVFIWQDYGVLMRIPVACPFSLT